MLEQVSQRQLAREMRADSANQASSQQGDFWRAIPGYRDVSRETFLDHSWQEKNAIRRPASLAAVLGKRIPESFYEDFSEGLTRSPMSVRVTPYIISLIDWDDPYQAEAPPFECLLAENDYRAIGFALFFHNYSTWRGKRGLWLEDLFVLPELRGQGVGKRLLLQWRAWLSNGIAVGWNGRC